MLAWRSWAGPIPAEGGDGGQCGEERAGLRVDDSVRLDVWQNFLRFARQRFDTARMPDADGLLFHDGTHASDGPPKFALDLTRQFDIYCADCADCAGYAARAEEDEGESHYVQLHCEIRSPPEPALDGLGSYHSWLFHDHEESLDRWSSSRAPIGNLCAAANPPTSAATRIR